MDGVNGRTLRVQDLNLDLQGMVTIIIGVHYNLLSLKGHRINMTDTKRKRIAPVFTEFFR